MKESWRQWQAHPVKKTIKSFLIIMIFVLAILIIKLVRTYIPELQKDIAAGYAVNSEITSKTFYPKQPTIIEDKNNHVLKKLSHSQSTYISSNKLNPLLKKGIVAVEDRRFYKHHGVDLAGILRAVKAGILKRQVQGGSTLTQQLVKNVVLKDQTQNFDRKIKEMVIAQQLEQKFSKKQILEFYLNDVYLGHGCYGMGSAAQYYFSKPQDKLDIAQTALLVGIPNNQQLYDPVLHPKQAKKRRNTVLYTWHKQRLLNSQQYHKACRQPIKLRIHNFKYDNDISQNYALNYAVQNTVQQLMTMRGFEMKYTFASYQAKNEYKARYAQVYDKYYGELLAGGYVVKTTIDPKLQQALVKIVQQQYEPYQQRDAQGKLEPQVASTVIDNRTGNVLAIIGGRTTKDDQLNRATDAYRQPGSTAKPLIAYAPAFERGYAPQSTVVDGPINNVHNWYSGYRGSVTLRKALADSINTVAYKLAVNDKQKSFYQDLAKMQFQGLYPSDNNPIIAIGGFTKGVTTTEMASAYSSFARSGNFVAPSNLKSIYSTTNDRILYQNSHNQVPVYSKNASYMMLNAMQSVVNDGLGKDAKLDNYSYVAGKTGTTDNNLDSYFVGMTPYFTIANWTGYDHQKPLSDDQLSLSIKTFKAQGDYLVKALHESQKDFAMPNTIRRNGDNLYVRRAVVQKSIDQMIQENYITFNSDQINQNKKRLANLDYRLIYHLTGKQEHQREQTVKQAIANYQYDPLTKLSDYGNKLGQLQKIRYKNENVKRMNAKRKFNKQIMQLQRELNLAQAQLQAQKDDKHLASFESKKSAIEKNRDAQRQAIVNRLMKQYQDQLAKTKSAYQSDASDKETQKQKLTDLINQIRSYGGHVSDPVIRVN
ncbi:transglycosylase domain-containing protein [Bombilactobacillus thymidiniphilus]|uniref:Transglycosylase domain-containing protein n=1 Tax=Bombilactobacillus thymidiniphilus TaxID=2923363 RepID=A0ABY4PFL4_9LACO|nr:transglycosylase domain-containing protein [Bombilactobacillus thymidiniphilus]UQS84313.1 transglycosylase domain-containing protein [Bombilactobacillus thymidiniphilus]